MSEDCRNAANKIRNYRDELDCAFKCNDLYLNTLTDLYNAISRLSDEADSIDFKISAAAQKTMPGVPGFIK